MKDGRGADGAGGQVPAGGEDEGLAAQAAGGDTGAFRLLVRRYERPLYGMGRSFLRNDAQAADFTQEVFLKAWRNLGRFEGRARFSTWLYRIAYNTAINSLTRRKEYVSLVENEDAPARERTPEEEAVREAVRKAVREAVAALPERYRVCVDLYFFYDRSFREIEGITGFPENTVKSHVFRAKKLLRESLSDF